jgi:hypothetical protein
LHTVARPGAKFLKMRLVDATHLPDRMQPHAGAAQRKRPRHPTDEETAEHEQLTNKREIVHFGFLVERLSMPGRLSRGVTDLAAEMG